MDFRILPVLHVYITCCIFTLAVSLNLVSSYLVPVSYADYCASMIPESTRSTILPPERRVHDGYYTGGGSLFDPNPSPISSTTPNWIRFWAQNLYLTELKRVYDLEAQLEVETRNGDIYVDSLTHAHTSSILFKLNGFWDESSGKLCMVGSSSTKTRSGTCLDLPVVFKLNGLENSSTITSLVTGVLESLSPDYSNAFQIISVLMFPHMNYKYTSVSEEMFDSNQSMQSLSLSLGSDPIKHFCRALSWSDNRFLLTYANDCDSTNNCNPLSSPDEHLPTVIYFDQIVHKRICSDNGQDIRVLIDLSDRSYAGYYRSFNPSTTLVAEGLWDEKTNKLFLVACRVLNASHSLADARIGGCSMRLSLWFPSVWSIRQRSSIVGEIWSTKVENDSGYFKKIVFRSAEDNSKVPGLKYEYTEISRSMELCSRKSMVDQRETYPNGYSFGMTLHDIVLKDAQGIACKACKGYAKPLSVGDQFYGSYSYEDSLSQANYSSNLVNISYKMTFLLMDSVVNLSSNQRKEVEISAEGVYDARTGTLCMVGCLNPVLNDKRLESPDCAIVVNLQFPPYNARSTIYTKGSIESTRGVCDPLYFERVEISAISFYAVETQEYIRRMEFRVSADLLSKAFSCIFSGFQLLHVRRYPRVLPFISIIMLLVLTLSQMTLLALDFRREVALLGSVWLERRKMMLNVATMTNLFLQFYLVKQVFSARVAKSFRDAEKKVMFLLLPIYFMAFLIAFLVHYRRNAQERDYFSVVPSASHLVGDPGKSLLVDLKSYIGFALDAFLLPQIMFNGITKSNEKALARSFYVGSPFVKWMLRMYLAHGILRSGMLPGRLEYIDPHEDFVYGMWDLPFTCVFGIIIWFQQDFCDASILRWRLRQTKCIDGRQASRDNKLVTAQNLLT